MKLQVVRATFSGCREVSRNTPCSEHTLRHCLAVVGMRGLFFDDATRGEACVVNQRFCQLASSGF